MARELFTLSPDDFEIEYGHPYPRDIYDWKFLAAYAGLNGQVVYDCQWTEAEVAPIIEGWLQHIREVRLIRLDQHETEKEAE